MLVVMTVRTVLKVPFAKAAPPPPPPCPSDVSAPLGFTATYAIDAPCQNSVLLKSVFQLSNKAVSYATSLKMSKHLHSLSEKLVTFSCFDDAVLFEKKQHMVAKLRRRRKNFLKRLRHPLGFLKNKHL